MDGFVAFLPNLGNFTFRDNRLYRTENCGCEFVIVCYNGYEYDNDPGSMYLPGLSKRCQVHKNEIEFLEQKHKRILDELNRQHQKKIEKLVIPLQQEIRNKRDWSCKLRNGKKITQKIETRAKTAWRKQYRAKKIIECLDAYVGPHVAYWDYNILNKLIVQYAIFNNVKNV